MVRDDFVEDFLTEVQSYQPFLPPSSFLELVAYEEFLVPNSAERGDHHAAFRLSVLYGLLQSFSLEDRAFIRFLLEQEILYHNHSWGFSERIKVAAFLLFVLAEVEDVQLLWRAKTASFDTMCGLDDQLLVGAGTARTIEYLQRAHESWSEKARTYIEEGHWFRTEELVTYRTEITKQLLKRASLR